MSNETKTIKGQNSATVNQHPPAHREGWMIKWSGNSFLLGSSSLVNDGG